MKESIQEAYTQPSGNGVLAGESKIRCDCEGSSTIDDGMVLSWLSQDHLSRPGADDVKRNLLCPQSRWRNNDRSMTDKLIALSTTVGQPPDQILEASGMLRFDQDPDLPANKGEVV